jgi:hypothetical protein
LRPGWKNLETVWKNLETDYLIFSFTPSYHGLQLSSYMEKYKVHADSKAFQLVRSEPMHIYS